MAEASHAARDIVDRLNDRAESGERVSIGEVVEAVGSRGYGPLLFVPALVELSPIGAIPGVPTLLAIIIVLFSAQIAAGRSELWLPQALQRRSIPRDDFKRASDFMRPVAAWLDRHFHGRLQILLAPPVIRAGAVVTILLCLTVPPLELIPWASSAPMAAIAMFGLAMLARDGLLMAFALAVVVASGLVAVELLPIGGGAPTSP